MKSSPDIREAPFSVLVKSSPELAELRAEYAEHTPTARRNAAEFIYSASAADDLLQRAGLGLGNEDPVRGLLDSLAIDPDFPPALLAVGSVEYQLGRINEAMALFLHLTSLPAATEDLEEIIEKAASCLNDAGDFALAERLYRAAVAEFPDHASYHGGLGYCASKLGRKGEALGHARKAVELDPTNPELVGDLGWSLIENKQYPEAEACLLKASAMAPGQTMAEKNLVYLRKLLKEPS